MTHAPRPPTPSHKLRPTQEAPLSQQPPMDRWSHRSRPVSITETGVQTGVHPLNRRIETSSTPQPITPTQIMIYTCPPSPPTYCHNCAHVGRSGHSSPASCRPPMTLDGSCRRLHEDHQLTSPDLVKITIKTGDPRTKWTSSATNNPGSSGIRVADQRQDVPSQPEV